jgi:hypothetical protein
LLQRESEMAPRILPVVSLEDQKIEYPSLNPSNVVQAGPHIENASELVNYVVFNEDCCSLLSKHLSYEIWNKYAGKKDSAGVTFE